MSIPACHIAERNGAVSMFVDGVAISSAAYFCTLPTEARISAMRRAGISTITWGVGGPVAHCSDIGWVGPDSYDYSHLDQAAELILQHHPEAWLLPRIAVTAPKWWLEAHPDQQSIMATGRPTGNHVGVGPVWCKDPRTTIVSQASDLWQQHCEAALGKLVAHIDASSWGHRCIGLQPTGGENEWFVSHAQEYPDYSTLAVDAYRAWLQERGVANAAQQEPPRPDELQRGTWGAWFDPAQGHHCQNWWRFYHELNANRLRQTCAAIKRASDNRLIVGAFYGYIGDSYANSKPAAWLYGHHHNLREVVDDPAIDYLASPFSYVNRQLGGTPENQVPNAACELAGIFTFTENDLGTFWSVRDESEQAVAKSRNTMIRDQGKCIIRRQGFWWMDLHIKEDWYTHPILERQIKALTDLQNEQAQRPASQWRPQIAVVLGNDTPFHCRAGHSLLAEWVTRPLRDVLPAMGAPFEVITMADLARSNLPAYKLFIFLDVPAVDPAQRAQIHAVLAERQAWAYWHGLPGLIDGTTLDIANSSALVGMDLTILGGKPQLGQGRRITARFSDFDHPLTLDVPASHTIGGAPCDAIAFIADSEAQVFARQSLKGRPAMAVKQTSQGYTSVYSSLAGAPPTFFRNLARAAGVHVFTDRDAVVDACDDLLMVHQIGPAPVQVQVHRPAAGLVDCFTQQQWPVVDGQVLFKGAAYGHGYTHLCRLTPPLDE